MVANNGDKKGSGIEEETGKNSQVPEQNMKLSHVQGLDGPLTSSFLISPTRYK